MPKVKKKKSDGADDRMVLRQALKLLKEKYPWLLTNPLREQVAAGKIPSIRSSGKSRAYYYVRLADLEKALAIPAE
jgi:hypothetical protein